MKNLVVVSLNDENAKTCAQNLAIKLKLHFVDAEEEFNQLLISSIDVPTILVDDVLQTKESELLLKLSKINNSVIYLPNDTFASNENYKIFKNCLVLLLETENLTKIKQNIQNFLKKHSNLFILNNSSTENIIKLIKQKNI